MRHVDIGYLAQSLPGEDLVIRSGLLAIKRTSYIVRQEVGKVGSDVARGAGVDRVRRGESQGQPVPVPGGWSQLLPQWPERRVIALVGDTEIAFDDIGSGLPVVFVHAFPLNRTMWEPQVGALVARMPLHHDGLPRIRRVTARSRTRWTGTPTTSSRCSTR